MEEASLRRGNLGSVIMEASRRHLEIARSLPEGPAWHSESSRMNPEGTQEASRRHPGGSKEAPRRQPRHPRLQRPLREKTATSLS